MARKAEIASAVADRLAALAREAGDTPLARDIREAAEALAVLRQNDLTKE